MGIGIKRFVQTGQIGLRQLFINVDGTLATPTVNGFDQFGIASIQDLAVGRYKINFSKPFARACELAGFSMKTADTTLVVEAQDASSITINTIDMAGANIDAKFFLNIVGSDFSYNT